MGLITGYICLILATLLLFKYVAKRAKWVKLNSSLMKIHKLASVGFLLLSLLHLFFVFPVLDTRNIWIDLSGFMMIGSAFLLVIFCHLIKNRKKELHFHRFFSLLIGLFLVVHVIMYFVDFNQYKASIKELSFEEVDLRKISDGEFYGSCDCYYINAKVKVVVENHQIVDIVLLEHNHERGSKAEEITLEMVSQNRIDVDCVSGATNSSKVIKQACVNALLGKE